MQAYGNVRETGPPEGRLDTMLLRRIVEVLPRYSYRFGSESELHSGIASVLESAGIAFQHEVVVGPSDRFDFLVPDGIVLEVKTNGSLPAALRQVDRYAARADVRAVVLVASRFWARGSRREFTLHDKPVRVLKLSGAAF